MNKIGTISNTFMKFLYISLCAASFRFILETFGHYISIPVVYMPVLNLGSKTEYHELFLCIFP